MESHGGREGKFGNDTGIGKMRRLGMMRSLEVAAVFGFRN
jgi:hypothetical protein